MRDDHADAFVFDKADMLPRLSQGDPPIPAGRISREQAMVLGDREAAARWQFQPSR
jgi:hypothetical protein